jgi:hypothetical protein
MLAYGVLPSLNRAYQHALDSKKTDSSGVFRISKACQISFFERFALILYVFCIKLRKNKKNYCQTRRFYLSMAANAPGWCGVNRFYPKCNRTEGVKKYIN